MTDEIERLTIQTEQTVSLCCHAEWMLSGGRKVCRECGQECGIKHE